MRSRNIKPGFFKDEELAAIPLEDRFQARYLFAGLWCLADCEGRLEDRPKTIRLELFGHDEEIGAAKVHHLLEVLADHQFIVRYEAAGRKYIWVKNFAKHQSPHKEEKSVGSKLPCYQQVEAPQSFSEAPPTDNGGTPEVPPLDNGGPQDDSLIPDSLIAGFPDSLIPDSRTPEVRALAIAPKAEPPDYFPMFWGLFVAAGVALNDRDKERTLRLWMNHDPPRQKRIISWVIQQMKSGAWSDAKHTPYPYNALKTEGWTRIASERVLPNLDDSSRKLTEYLEQQRAMGLR